MGRMSVLLTRAVAILLLTATMAWAQTRESDQLAPQPSSPPVAVDTNKTVVLIFSHGTVRPQRRHECNETRDVPRVVTELATENGWRVHYLCSAATDEGIRGSYTYKRADEILAAIQQYRAAGIPAKNIFLFGHSAGGWSSLMAARKDPTSFNAVVAFAPAFAGPRSEQQQFPEWRGTEMPRQIAYLSEAKRINALIFSYDDDTFDRPQELEPLRKVPSLTVLPFNACHMGHRTVYTDCFRQNAKAQIVMFVRNNLK